WSTSKTPSYTKSVSWQHHPKRQLNAPKALKNKKSQGGTCLAFRAGIFTRWQRWDGDPMWI
ncbi:hypothetical protein, partial [Serratia ureilytica]|uniref:hypothetical protein n=1 Tax=Serratia ureilytica TaxID=300181 RepID=UPI003F7E3376